MLHLLLFVLLLSPILMTNWDYSFFPEVVASSFSTGSNNLEVGKSVVKWLLPFLLGLDTVDGK